jgi:hypothetical protein
MTLLLAAISIDGCYIGCLLASPKKEAAIGDFIAFSYRDNAFVGYSVGRFVAAMSVDLRWHDSAHTNNSEPDSSHSSSGTSTHRSS